MLFFFCRYIYITYIHNGNRFNEVPRHYVISLQINSNFNLRETCSSYSFKKQKEKKEIEAQASPNVSVALKR